MAGGDLRQTVRRLPVKTLRRWWWMLRMLVAAAAGILRAIRTGAWMVIAVRPDRPRGAVAFNGTPILLHQAVACGVFTLSEYAARRTLTSQENILAFQGKVFGEEYARRVREVRFKGAINPCLN